MKLAVAPAPGDVCPHNATNERRFGVIRLQMRPCAEMRDLSLGGERP